MPATCLEAQDGVQDELSMQPDEGKKLLEASAPASSAGSTASLSLGEEKPRNKTWEKRDETPGMIPSAAAGHLWCIHWPFCLSTEVSPPGNAQPRELFYLSWRRSKAQGLG